MMNSLAFTIVVLMSVTSTLGQEQSRIEKLGWMSGCWESVDKARDVRTSEHWMSPAGGSMIGMSRTVRGGRMTEYEFLRIENTPKGLAYIAHPKGAASDTAFHLARTASNEAIFENLAHDFPQRIIYKRSGDDLMARIEGMAGGKLKGIDYPMKRAACE